MSWTDFILEPAKELGGLPSSAILAAIVIALGYKDYQRSKDEHEQALERLQAWQDASVAENKQTEAILGVSEAAKMTAQAQARTAEEVRLLAVKIEERIPHK